MCYAWDQDAPGLSEVKLSHPLRISCVTSVVGPSDLADGEMVAFIFSPAGLLIPPVRGVRMLMGWLTGTDMINMDMTQASVTIRKWAPVTLVKKASCPAILAYACTDATVNAGSTDLIVPVSNFVSVTNRLSACGVSYDARLFMRTKHWEVGLNCAKGQGVEWISDRLAAFKAKHFDVPLRGSGQTSAQKPRVVMNIVNFVRSLDPRHPRSWHGRRCARRWHSTASTSSRTRSSSSTTR